MMSLRTDYRANERCLKCRNILFRMRLFHIKPQILTCEQLLFTKVVYETRWLESDNNVLRVREYG